MGINKYFKVCLKPFNKSPHTKELNLNKIDNLKPQTSIFQTLQSNLTQVCLLDASSLLKNSQLADDYIHLNKSGTIPLFTPLLALANVLIILCQLTDSSNWNTLVSDYLELNLGKRGEWWRFYAYFWSGGLLSQGFSLVNHAYFGTTLETFFGTSRLVIVHLVTVLSGSLATSLYFHQIGIDAQREEEKLKMFLGVLSFGICALHCGNLVMNYQIINIRLALVFSTALILYLLLTISTFIWVPIFFGIGSSFFGAILVSLYLVSPLGNESVSKWKHFVKCCALAVVVILALACGYFHVVIAMTT